MTQNLTDKIGNVAVREEIRNGRALTVYRRVESKLTGESYPLGF
jgi:hypothetical protein